MDQKDLSKWERLAYYPAAILFTMYALNSWLKPHRSLHMKLIPTVVAILLWSLPWLSRKTAIPARLLLVIITIGSVVWSMVAGFWMLGTKMNGW